MPKKRKKAIGKKMREFSLKTRLKSSDLFKKKTLELFKDYIKTIIVWGSITRGDYTGKSDVDIYIIFDDTKMPLKRFDEIRSKVDRDITKISKSIDPRLHTQPVIALTEFWDGIRQSHPLFHCIVREGYAIYDTGFFIPMRKLMEWGKFPATIEAAELRMSNVPKRIRRVESVKTYMIAEDLYMAILDAAQALLMYVGVPPPPPKMAAQEMRKHLVGPGLLEDEYAQTMEDVMAFRKKVEHKEIKSVKGEKVDKWIERAKKYVKRMIRLLNTLRLRRKAVDVQRSYELMIKGSMAALKSMNKLPKEPKKLPEAFHKHLIESGLLNPNFKDVFSKVIKMRKMLKDKKLHEIPEKDIYMHKEYVRRFLMDVKRIMSNSGLPKEIEKIQYQKREEPKKEKTHKNKKKSKKK